MGTASHTQNHFVDATVTNGAVALTDGFAESDIDPAGNTTFTSLTLELFEAAGSSTIRFMLSNSTTVFSVSGQVLSSATGSTPLTLTPEQVNSADWASVIAPFGDLSALDFKFVKQELHEAIDQSYLSPLDAKFALQSEQYVLGKFDSVLDHLS